uniref:non-ribosomal peptide synthetase n=1 Tax=Herbidospora sakaeratensis TaxID=564415 RepID=UPI000780C5B6|nr:non-ribosomal peptide synthetase [Herbidospora sakaeratensis]
MTIDISREELIRLRLSGGGRRRAGVPAADRTGPLPLSFGQERLWFLSRLAPDSPEYLVPLALRLPGPVDEAALGAALTALVARHEILRTRYALAGAQPVQVIDPPPRLTLPAEPVGDLPAALAAEAAAPIDVETDHPLRARLFSIGPGEHVLSLVLHHIACDNRSLGILVEELAALYREKATGVPAGLRPLSVQYADHAAWQRGRVAGPGLERALAHWRAALDGITPLDLPSDRPRAAVRDWAGDEVVFELSAARTAALRAVAAEAGTTLFTVLLTAYQVLLAGRAGRRDVAVGTAMAARSRPHEQDLVGLLLNTLVLRARWEGDPSFADLLDDGRAFLLGALDHQEVPLHLLMDAARTPLFQVMFDLLEGAGAGGGPWEQLETGGGVAKFDLTLQLAERPDGSLLGGLGYAGALFDRATADRLTAGYLRVLDLIAADPGVRVSELTAMTEGDRHALLRAGDGGPPLPRHPSVEAAVAAHARRAPDAPAVRCAGETVSYADLDGRADAVARRLIGLGVGRGDVVGVCLDRGPLLLPALLGVWRAGAAYVPVEPGHPDERIAEVLVDAGATVTLSESAHAARLPGQVVALDREAFRAGPPVEVPAPGPDEAAYMIYTSGSTGKPKGVLVTHGGLANYLAWAARDYAGGAGHGAPLFSSVAYDLVVTTLYTPLLLGRPVTVIPKDVEAAGLADALAARAPYDFVKLTPGHLELLPPDPGLAGTLVVGGEGFATRLAVRWRGTKVVNEYGPTEITVANSTHVADGRETGDLLPIGRPIPGTTMYVLDEDLRPVPPGVLGELHVGGLQLAHGYHNRPGLTADRFVPDPFGPPGARLYRTGDVCRVLPGGAVEYLRRADDQVKVRGHRVEPAEVEAALAARPGVRACVVTLLDGALVAHVVAADPGAPPAPGELRDALARSLPAHMVPAAFVAVDALPLTANGKVDRRALPAPTRDDRDLDAGYVAPGGGAQTRVAEVWRTVLGLDEVGAGDNFFDVGGDSLRAVALVGALRDLGLDLSVQDVFERPTIAAMAALAADRPDAEDEPGTPPFALITEADRALLPAGVQDAYPLSLVQAGMVYEMLTGDGANHYLNTTTYEIRDGRPFSPEAMRAAAALMTGRHELLRTSIDLTGYGEPLQLVHDRAELPVELTDLTGLTPAEQDRRVRAFMAAERRTLFDLARPSLLRMRAFVFGPGRWALTITECHAILEGWSYHQLLMELLTTYQDLVSGRDPVTPEIPRVRFADFVAAERDSLAGEADRAFWAGVVGGAARFEPPPAWRGEGGQYKIEVAFDDLLPKLTTLARDAEVPLKSVLHAAHLTVMNALTHERDFFTGLVCDARPEASGADRVLGMFLNTVPFAFRLSAPTWRETVKDVFAREIALWPHRRFPVPAMQREFAGGRRLIDVMFNYLDFRSVDEELVDIHHSIDDSPNEFPLSVTVFRLGVVDLTIHADVIGREHGELLAAMYRSVLEALAEGLDGDPRDALPAFPGSSLHGPTGGTVAVHEAVARHARERPESAAVVCAAGVTTYADLDAGANRLAHHLRGLGAGPGTLVAVCLPPGPELVTSVLAVLRSGAAYVPLDPAHRGDRLTGCLADSGALTVITRSEVLGDAGGAVLLDRDAAVVAARPATDPEVPVSPGDLAYVIYTSGSTGRPKGVMVTHGGLGNYLAWAAAAYGPARTHGAVVAGSVAFDLAVTSLLLPLVLGRDVVFEDVARAMGTAEEYTLLKITPAHLEALRGGVADAGNVATFVVGGEQLRTGAVEAVRALAPHARFVNEYGPTETVVGCCVHEARPGAPGAVVPIGRPIAGTVMRVLDASLVPVPPGVAGELCIGGDGVARGYLNRPALTAERFVPDPLGPPGARLYRTGDLGVVRGDGDLEYLGRLDDQLKVRGHRIEPGEVEAHLRAHPAVRDAVVTAPGGRLTAHVVADGEADVIGFLGGRLPAYMVPSVVVPIAEVPLGAGGKVDRRALPEPGAAAPRPYREPRPGAEALVAQVWARVIGVGRAGGDDDFFDLGGDSILAVHAVAAARRAGLAVTPRMVLERRTPAAVAAALAEEAVGSAAEQGPVTGEVPVTPIMLAFADEGADLREYPQIAHLRVDPAPDPGLLERALHDVVAHHDMLRLRLDGGRMVLPAAEDRPLLRVRTVAPGLAAETLRAEAAALSPDPATGPAVAAVLVESGAGPADLLVAAHRLTVDGVSWRFVVDDLNEAYRRRETGREPAPPPKTTAFRDWAARLRSADAAAELPYWRDRGPYHPIPVDFDGENTQAGQRELTVGLDLGGPVAGLRDLLLAALVRAFTRRTGGDRLLVEVEAHGRPADPDVSRTVGWFTVLHPVELGLADQADDQAAEVARALRAVPGGGVGHGVLRDRLADLPEPQIRFNYTGAGDAGRGGDRFTPAPGGPSPARAVTGRRSRLFEVDAAARTGALTVTWAYSPNAHAEATVRGLALDHLAELRALLEGKAS